jgi:HTH-type transcriptional regulator/antitoxin HigA
MEAKILSNEAEYAEAVGRVSALMSAEAGTRAAEEQALWAFLVADYERRVDAVAAPDALAAIRFRMEQAGLSPRDLEPFIGGKGRVSEILSGKRALSLAMIRRLHDGLGIPLEALIRQPERLSAH